MSKFLDSLGPELLDAIRRVGVSVEFESGQVVFNRGDPGMAVYVIKEASGSMTTILY